MNDIFDTEYKLNESCKKALADWQLENAWDCVGMLSFDFTNDSVANACKTLYAQRCYEERRIEQICKGIMNVIDRVFWGHLIQSKNATRTQRFVFKHLGDSGMNEHRHFVMESDSRIDFVKFCDLVTEVMRYWYFETTTTCGCCAIRESKEQVANYNTHEFNQLENDTLQLSTTHIAENEYDRKWNNDIQRRIDKLYEKLEVKKYNKLKRIAVLKKAQQTTKRKTKRQVIKQAQNGKVKTFTKAQLQEYQQQLQAT